MGAIATALKHMLAAGMAHDAIVSAVADMEVSGGKVRTAGAIRQERYRDRHKPSQSVTSDDGDAAKERSPTPPKENTTTSLRSVVSLKREREEFCEKAWRVVPKRRGDLPKKFKDALMRALANGADPVAVTEGLQRYAASEASNPEPQFRKGSTVWVNGRGWEADYSPQGQSCASAPVENAPVFIDQDSAAWAKAIAIEPKVPLQTKKGRGAYFSPEIARQVLPSEFPTQARA